ncbi:MAG: GTPase, partial [Deltaproteobacteria bacterium]
AGSLYPEGIPIIEEGRLAEVVRREQVDEVVFAYSDVTHQYVMHQASLALAAGADFSLLGTRSTCLKSKKPLVSICAVRTGVGKSQTTRYVVKVLQQMGKKVVAIRHPMPYGDLARQVSQRFATMEDMDRHQCTIEEREEYEPHINNGVVVYAGVDYGKILEQAESEADVIIWDGGNNDLPFYQPDLHIVLVDPHRPGHELKYHPGEANLRMADIVVINKITTAKVEWIAEVQKNIAAVNPGAQVVKCDSPITVEDPAAVKGKRVLVVEDGPTLTHGEMSYGAGTLAAEHAGAASVVDPRPQAVGSIAEALKKYSHVGALLPAMGYSEQQLHDLEQTINRVDCDLVLIGTPIDLRKVIKINKPAMRVFYELADHGEPTLAELIRNRLGTGA